MMIHHPKNMDKGHFSDVDSDDLEDFLFDDCDICQVEKNALREGRSATMAELVEAFEKVENQHQKRGLYPQLRLDNIEQK